MPDDESVLSNIEPIEIQEEMERSFLDYAMSVITSRALPDARDGLKPVQRRILYGMYDQGMRPDRQHRKCANAVGHGSHRRQHCRAQHVGKGEQAQHAPIEQVGTERAHQSSASGSVSAKVKRVATTAGQSGVLP